MCLADTACCLNPYNQTYYNFDDHEVKEATAKQVKVYLLVCVLYECTPLPVAVVLAVTEWSRLFALLHITEA